MTHQLTHRRRMLGLGSLLALALVAALAAAALSTRAEGHPQVSAEFLIGGGDVGNSFPDDFRVQYRLKYGEADSHEYGMRDTHVVNLKDASNVRMGKLTFDENASVPWHTHPGPLIVGIAKGALTVTWSDDCEPRTYNEGEAFVDLGQQVHMAKNLSGGTTVVYFVGIGIPDGVPVTDVVDGEFC
jgi:quercetin dioxygenase-like cupin family protein